MDTILYLKTRVIIGWILQTKYIKSIYCGLQSIVTNEKNKLYN